MKLFHPGGLPPCPRGCVKSKWWCWTWETAEVGGSLTVCGQYNRSRTNFNQIRKLPWWRDATRASYGAWGMQDSYAGWCGWHSTVAYASGSICKPNNKTQTMSPQAPMFQMHSSKPVARLSKLTNIDRSQYLDGRPFLERTAPVWGAIVISRGSTFFGWDIKQEVPVHGMTSGMAAK